ncbi:baseplate J protein [Saccharibacillus sp. O16]|nr:baseplate J protein [Saccharibacillus sp. O16]
MTNLLDLPDITFYQPEVKALTDELIAEVERLEERTLYPGDPIRLLLQGVAMKLVQQQVLINQTAKATLLRYAPLDVLRHMGAPFGVEQLPAEPAVATIRFTLSIPISSATIIPAGIRIGPEGGGGELYFSTTDILQIPAGSQSGTVSAECSIPGTEGNGFLPGQLNVLIDPLPFVSSVGNVTESAGGAAAESVDSLRERIRQAPESFSTAGPSGAYEFWAKSAYAAIIDVKSVSPAPMEVLVVPLLNGGVLPSQDALDAVAHKLNDKTIRPQTDKVTVAAPSPIEYDINLTYYILRSRAAESAAIQAAVNQAVEDYQLWQRIALGRDIDPSELIFRVRDAGAIAIAVTSPAQTPVADTEVAQDRTVNVTFGGLRDG